MRARSALFTLFGDVVRPAGGEAWLGAITQAMALLDFQPQAVRTALHRMAGEGWVAPRREGRYAAYRLTDKGVDRLEAAARRIYRLRSRPWDGRWQLLVTPDVAAVEEVAAEIAWVGYGRLTPTLWISPGDHREEVAPLRAALADDAVLLDRALGEDDADLAARAWDLEGLRSQHEAFLASWVDTPIAEEPDKAFAQRLRLVHQWRKFLFTDPGLPREVLPDDWLGGRAAEVFRGTYEALLAPSWDWYRAAAARAIAADDLDPVIPQTAANPFAVGLAALEHNP